jgi:hypothetical protein
MRHRNNYFLQNFGIWLHNVTYYAFKLYYDTHLLYFVGRERLPGVADRPNLSYTEAVLHESMRLASFVPSGLFHQASCDSEVCK